MDLAVKLCEAPRMSNLAHGLWGYHGQTGEGNDLTVQSLGIGGASAAAVVADLARFGVRRAIRIGSCIGLDPVLELGASLVPGAIFAEDGAGRALSNRRPLKPHPGLARALVEATGAERPSAVRSVDVLPGPNEGAPSAVDLSSAAFVAAADHAGIDCACVLVVGESAGGEELARDALDEALLSLGTRSAAALFERVQASGP